MDIPEIKPLYVTECRNNSTPKWIIQRYVDCKNVNNVISLFCESSDDLANALGGGFSPQSNSGTAGDTGVTNTVSTALSGDTGVSGA